MNNLLKRLGLILTLHLLCQCGKVVTPGSEVGNGGNAVVCRDEGGKISSVRLLDYYEGKVLRDTHYELGDANLSASDKVKLVLNRLATFDTKKAQTYQYKADGFFKNARFVNAVKLSDTKDYGYVPIPAACNIEQLCVQKKPTDASEKLYSINIDLWDRLDNDHRAGLMIHEIVYRDALDRGQKDSVRARLFTALVSSNKFEKLTANQYRVEVKALSLDDGAPASSPVWLTSPILLTACAGQKLTANFQPFIHQVEGEHFVYSSDVLPAWMTLSSDGVFVASPGYNQMGYAFTVRATNVENISTANSVTLSVRDCNPPVLRDQTLRFQARAGAAFRGDLNTWVPGATARFQMVLGPSWITVAENGEISGTPSTAQTGNFRFLVNVTREGQSSVLTVTIDVAPDSIWVQAQLNLGRPVARTPYYFDLRTLVNRTTDEKLSFSVTQLPSWLTLSTTGLLSGTPGASDVGTFQATFTVTYDGGSQTAEGMGEVLRSEIVPIFKRDPINAGELRVGQSFSFSLAQYVATADGSPLRFAKLSGPDWLSVSADGRLSGTATAADPGFNSLIVTATTGTNISASVTVRVYVQSYPN